tara:strand:+ start:1226 stop:1495 length:270 start_codon:yes stop_codon:yes gene_type:complete
MKAKSKAVRELINIIYTAPELFKADASTAFSSDRYEISLLGNTRCLSVAWLYIDKVRFELSFRDAWALEVAYGWWIRNVPLTSYVKGAK